MSPKDKPLVWLHGEVKTPPLSAQARLEAGYLAGPAERGIAFHAAIQAYAWHWQELP